MRTDILSGFIRCTLPGTLCLASLAGEVLWAALHLSTLYLVGLSMYWTCQSMPVSTYPLAGLLVFIVLAGFASYILAAICCRYATRWNPSTDDF